HFVERLDDALRDRVMAASGAQSGLVALVSGHLEANAIDLLRRRRWNGRRCHLSLNLLGEGGSLLGNDGVGHASRVDGQPVVVQDAAQLFYLFPAELQPEEARKLLVAVLLDHVNAPVLPDEVYELVPKGIGPNATIARGE